MLAPPVSRTRLSTSSVPPNTRRAKAVTNKAMSSLKRVALANMRICLPVAAGYGLAPVVQSIRPDSRCARSTTLAPASRRLRAPSPDRAPGSQASEHHAALQRRHQSHGLRAREDARGGAPRRHRDRRGRERGRPRAPDAGPARRRGPARSRQRRAHHPHAQRPADAGGQGRRQRHPHRTLRAQQLGALSRRRHAARGGATQPCAACGADLALEDHGLARHRRKTPAPRRAHFFAPGPARHRCACLHLAQCPW